MIRTHVLKVLEERNTALLEAMLLAVHGNGHVADPELHTVLRHVLDSPEFQGEPPEQLAGRLRRIAESLTLADDEALFASLRRRLPDARNRLLAYGLAARVAIEDVRLLDSDEVQRVSRIQQGLAVSPAQARALLSGLAEGASPTEVASEPPNRLGARLLELVLLSEGLDACLSPEEVTALHVAQEDPPLLRELCGQLLRRLAFGCQVDASPAAVRRHLEELALVPSTLASRGDALRLAVRFCGAVGHGWPQELLLCFVQELFGLTDEDVWTRSPGSEGGNVCLQRV